jgi:hypothetical protein
MLVQQSVTRADEAVGIVEAVGPRVISIFPLSRSTRPLFKPDGDHAWR